MKFAETVQSDNGLMTSTQILERKFFYEFQFFVSNISDSLSIRKNF
jgi:hypothetical protein